MTNAVTGIIGISLVITFLGIMLLWVPALPLIVIVVVVMALLVTDYWLSVRSSDGDLR